MMMVVVVMVMVMMVVVVVMVVVVLMVMMVMMVIMVVMVVVMVMMQLANCATFFVLTSSAKPARIGEPGSETPLLRWPPWRNRQLGRRRSGSVFTTAAARCWNTPTTRATGKR